MVLASLKEGSVIYSTKTGTRLEAESAMFRRFDHPTIPIFFQIRNDILLMSAVAGKPLENTVARFSELTDNQKTNIFTSLLHGLHHIHTMFAVHGNINPQTIYLQDRGLKPVFVDLESSFLQGDNNMSVTDNGFFMAPEARRCGTYTCKSDVYSLGMVFGSLHLCKTPDQWPADHAMPVWTKIMMLIDPRARGMSSTVLCVMGQDDTAVPCRNPFFAALQSALSVYDSQRIRGWTDLSNMDATQPWDVAMQPMLLFASTFYDQVDNAVLNLVITTLHHAVANPAALSMVQKFSGDEAYLLACARINRAATLGFVTACAMAQVIEVTENIVAELMDDSGAMALVEYLKLSRGAACIVAHIHAGAKRKADEAMRATARASEVNQALAQMAAIAQSAMGR
jgi:hypothetical protein